MDVYPFGDSRALGDHSTTSCRVARRTRGQAMVEFALVLPVLLFMLVMTIDVGRLFYSYVGVANAAREGAAYAIASDASGNPRARDTSTVAAYALQELTGDASAYAVATVCRDNAGAIIACTSAVGANGQTVTVTVSTPFEFMIPVIGPTVDLSSSSTGPIQ